MVLLLATNKGKHLILVNFNIPVKFYNYLVNEYRIVSISDQHCANHCLAIFYFLKEVHHTVHMYKLKFTQI